MLAQHELENGLRGKLSLYEPLTRLTSWRVGGPAQRLYRPADLADLAEFLRRLPAQEPLFWLGLGSNVLIRDGGVYGTAIATHGGLKNISLTGANSLRVEAGLPCAKAARFSARHGLSGAEFLAGIPGTMGGALSMNAGAWGGETWQRVKAVETIDRTGQIRLRMPSEFEIGYRSCRGAVEEWFVAAHLELEFGDAEESLALIRQFLEQRNLTQPTGVASCGSVFRNPPGDYAARLIEVAGLKGLCIGGASVSTKHANFIVNEGSASASDIEALIEKVATTVAEVHGVTLIAEVRIVGERTRIA
ncbi:MAG: UDP-N-acetylmuramate dehydrogenase [Candidatus Competibacteraceae bacterium]|nr:UDP-N-acetylmuramate dehydrogenase [Candidatus Competibacteraceae bacterium]MCB1804458.1 UDP-N-acetylmuramate dehydrogenase [Candidatus Competibacteraceae bacterium]MCB1810921.1 UDP-N-acetylmuramate dehydrogenase [Candidatus Competibacteraceae bacterium]